MYRAGWGLKDSGQKRILAIDIAREGFEWALEHSCLSHSDADISEREWQELKRRSPVRVQWDPERDLQSHPLPYRAIQICGLQKSQSDPPWLSGGARLINFVTHAPANTRGAIRRVWLWHEWTSSDV